MPVLVDDELAEGVAAEHAAHEADVVQEAGADQMGVIFGLDDLSELAPAKDVAPDDRHQHRMFEVVIERVASGDALDRAARQRAEALRSFIVCRAKNIEEISGQKLAEFPGRNCRYRFHRRRLPGTKAACIPGLDGRPPTLYLVQARPPRQRRRLRTLTRLDRAHRPPAAYFTCILQI